MASSSIARVVVGFLMVCCAVPSLATNYIVGDSTGWTTNRDYSSWTNGKTFAVGDTLVFNYGGGHTVDEVSASDYSSCTVGNFISSDSNGATSITLTTPGTHYFICGVLGHCSSGMKLAVTTIGGETNASTPLASPPPSNTTTITPSAPPSNSTTPPFDNTPTSLTPTSTPSSSGISYPSIIMLLVGMMVCLS